MNENRYVVEDDFSVNNAGFQNLSNYDMKRNEILSEMSRYSYKSADSSVQIRLVIMTLFLGLHRLTNGKILTGLLFAITLNGFGIWWLIDVFLIVSGKFTDKDGKPINYPAVYRLQQQLADLDRRHANGQI